MAARLARSSCGFSFCKKFCLETIDRPILCSICLLAEPAICPSTRASVFNFGTPWNLRFCGFLLLSSLQASLKSVQNHPCGHVNFPVSAPSIFYILGESIQKSLWRFPPSVFHNPFFL